jgi:hypothetical protein
MLKDRKSATISACHAPFLLVMLEFCGHVLGPIIIQIERRFYLKSMIAPRIVGALVLRTTTGSIITATTATIQHQ